MSKIYQTAYLRDSFIPFDQANLSIASSAVLYGLSTYTVMPIYFNNQNGELNLFRFSDHYRRLIDSAKILDFKDFISWCSEEKLRDLICELLTQNEVSADALVRMTVFVDGLLAGTTIGGIDHKLSIFVYEPPQILPEEGSNLMVSSWLKTPDNAIPARAKVNGAYVSASLMKNEALSNGYDDAIALDQAGHVTEGTVSNIFIVRNGRIMTPGVQHDLLEGITRDTVMKIAKELNIPSEFATIDRSELYIANEAFMSGSSVRISPILSIDKRLINDGKAGPITSQISELYQKIAHGLEPDIHNWLTKV